MHSEEMYSEEKTHWRNDQNKAVFLEGRLSSQSELSENFSKLIG